MRGQVVDVTWDRGVAREIAILPTLVRTLWSDLAERYTPECYLHARMAEEVRGVRRTARAVPSRDPFEVYYAHRELSVQLLWYGNQVLPNRMGKG